MSRYRLMVLGDVQIEAVGTAPGLRFAEVTSDRLAEADLSLSLGGTAANFACAAARHFAEVHLLGRVGDDAAGDLIGARLAAAGVRAHLTRDPDRPSGLAVVLRDGDAVTPLGTRLLLVRPGSANTSLSAEEIMRERELLSTMDALVVDGYATLAEPRRSACRRAMSVVAEAGGVVVFDVVPHDSYRRYGMAELRRNIAHASLVIGEVRTLNGFLGMIDHDGAYDRERVERVLPSLVEAFGDRALFLRFGLGNADESLCVLPGRPPEYRRTGYRDTPKPTGFGDRLTALELERYLPVLIGPRSGPAEPRTAGPRTSAP